MFDMGILHICRLAEYVNVKNICIFNEISVGVSVIWLLIYFYFCVALLIALTQQTLHCKLYTLKKKLGLYQILT